MKILLEINTFITIIPLTLGMNGLTAGETKAINFTAVLHLPKVLRDFSLQTCTRIDTALSHACSLYSRLLLLRWMKVIQPNIQLTIWETTAAGPGQTLDLSI
jgi:hypothetical protein